MSRKLSSRGSSAMFVTPRSGSVDDVETTGAAQYEFQHGPKMQMEAPEDPSQQQPQQHEQWVDQQQWEQEQQRMQQQWQEQGQFGQRQYYQGLVYAPENPQSTEALTSAVVEQLQQQVVVEAEDLNKMVGEGEWQKPVGKAPSWKYTRALSSYTGFASKSQEKAEKPEVQPSMSGIQMQNSGIYVEGVHQWNAVTNEPVQPLTQEARAIESRKFTFDARSGDYVNAYDPTDRMTAQNMEELRSALSKAAVEETVVDVMRRRSTMRKMKMVSRIFFNVEHKDLSTITGYDEVVAFCSVT